MQTATTPGFQDVSLAERNRLGTKDTYCRVCDDETASYDHGGHICRRCSECAASSDDLGAQFGPSAPDASDRLLDAARSIRSWLRDPPGIERPILYPAIDDLCAALDAIERDAALTPATHLDN